MILLFFLLLYVNDILSVVISMSKVNKLKTSLREEFDTKVWVQLKEFLGWRFPGTEIPENYGYLNAIMLKRC